MLNKENLFYLASPFTSKDSIEEERRYQQINRVGALLLLKDIFCIMPISSSYALSKSMELPSTFSFWKNIDFKYVEKCDALIVADLEGWDRSVGVIAEIEYAKILKKKVFLLDTDVLFSINTVELKEL